MRRRKFIAIAWRVPAMPWSGIFKANTSPVGTPWMWTVSYGFHEDHTPTHGYEATREAAMAAFAKSWRRE